MKKKHLLFLIILLVMVLFSGCQNEKYMDIQGRVIDANTSKPIAGANIKLYNYNLETDAQGNFAINDIPVVDNVDTKDKILTVSTAGYKTYSQIINLKEGNKIIKVNLSKRNEGEYFYSKKVEGKKAIFLSSLNNNHKAIIKDNNNNFAPDYSKKRNQLLFISDKDGNHNIYYYDLNTKKIKKITNTKSKKESAIWMNDKILFTSKRDGDYEIYKTNLNNTKLIQLTNNQSYDGFPAYSSNREMIAYISKGNENLKRIHIMNEEGGKNRLLNTSLTNDYFIKWKNGKLYFNNQYNKLIKVNPNGSNKQEILTTPENIKMLNFDLFKENILLIYKSDDKFSIKLYNLVENTMDNLIENSNKINSPKWRK